MNLQKLSKTEFIDNNTGETFTIDITKPYTSKIPRNNGYHVKGENLVYTSDLLNTIMQIGYYKFLDIDIAVNKILP